MPNTMLRSIQIISGTVTTQLRTVFCFAAKSFFSSLSLFCSNLLAFFFARRSLHNRRSQCSLLFYQLIPVNYRSLQTLFLQLDLRLHLQHLLVYESPFQQPKNNPCSAFHRFEKLLNHFLALPLHSRRFQSPHVLCQTEIPLLQLQSPHFPL